MRPTLAPLLAAASLTACSAGRTVANADDSTAVVVVTPADLDPAPGAAVIHRIPAARSVVVGSGDGALTLRVTTGSVARDSQLTIARLRADRTPKGVIGSAYLLSPELTSTLRPMRMALVWSELPAGVAAENLRLARLDTGGPFYQPVAGQAVLPEQRRAGATPSSFGVYALVDITQVAIGADVAPTAYWRGEHLLDIGLVEEAESELTAAVASDPTPQAGFALAFTRILNILSIPELDAFVQSCGEQPWRANELFAARGWFEQSVSRGELGLAELVAGRGYDDLNLIEARLEPLTVTMEQGEAAICAGTPGTPLPASHLAASLYDPSYAGSGTSFTLTVELDLDEPGIGVAPSSDGSEQTWVVPSEALRGWVEAAFDEQVDAARASKPSAAGAQAVGHYGLTAASGGTITVVRGSNATGEYTRLLFDDVVLEPRWDEQPRRILELDGSFEAPLTVSPPTPEMLGMAEEFSLGGLIEGCVDPVNEARLLPIVEALGSEAAAIATLFEEALAAGDFRYELSLGFVHQPGAISLGPVEAHVLAGLFRLAASTARIIGGYHWFSGDLRDSVRRFTDELPAPCDNPCDTSVSCTRSGPPIVTEEVSFGAVELTAAAAVLLSRDAAAGDLTAARDDLLAALDHAILALAPPSGEPTLLSFHNDSVKEGTETLLQILGEVRAGVLATSLQDGARQSFMPRFMTLGAFFADPPAASDLRALSGMPPDESPVLWTADNTSPMCSDGYPTYCSDVLCGPSAPAPLGCGRCGDPFTVAELCDPVPEGERSIGLADWVLDGLMELYLPSGELLCSDASACAPVEGASCSSGLCAYPAVTFDQASLSTLTDGSPMPVLDRRAATQLGQTGF